jgi:hypothetical protein
LDSSIDGETMATAASSFLNPVAADLDGIAGQPSALALARRGRALHAAKARGRNRIASA